MVSYGLEKMVKADLGSLNPCCSGRWSRTMLHLMVSFVMLTVLILVVVEDGLVQLPQKASQHIPCVLILVVVEDGLVPANVRVNVEKQCSVLILVVVEDGLVLGA